MNQINESKKSDLFLSLDEFEKFNQALKKLGDVKHAMANKIALYDGYLKKIQRTHPDLKEDESILKLQHLFSEFRTILNELQQTRTTFMDIQNQNTQQKAS